MKKLIPATIAIGACVLLACTGCTQIIPHDPNDDPKQITITSADELADYIRGYYRRSHEQESERQLLSDCDFRLTQTHGKSQGIGTIPEYPQETLAEVLPQSVTFIRRGGDFYSAFHNAAYGVDLSEGKFFLEEQSHEIYYQADSLTGYASVTSDRQPFATYPAFEQRERVFESDNRWTFDSADDFNTERDRAFGRVEGYLDEFLYDLFKISNAGSDPLPHIDANRFETLAISQSGDVVSFRIVYRDERVSSSATGALNVSEIDFRYDYREIRHEDGGVTIEREYRMELVSLTDGDRIDYDTDHPFVESPDYIVG